MLIQLHEGPDPDSPVAREVELEYPAEAFEVISPADCFALTVEYEADGPEWVASLVIEIHEQQHDPEVVPKDDYEKTDSEAFSLHHSEHHIIEDADRLRIRQRGKKRHKGTVEKFAPEKLADDEEANAMA